VHISIIVASLGQVTDEFMKVAGKHFISGKSGYIFATLNQACAQLGEQRVTFGHSNQCPTRVLILDMVRFALKQTIDVSICQWTKFQVSDFIP